MSPRILALILAAASLTACGGGGSDGASDPQAPDTSVIPGTTARFDKTSLTFGLTAVGRSSTQAVTLYNDGTAAADFSLMDNLPSGFHAAGCVAVPAGSSCELRVTFRPTSQGVKVGSNIAPIRAYGVTNRLAVSGVAIDTCAMAASAGAEQVSLAGTVPCP